MADDVTDEEELDADYKNFKDTKVVREFKPEGIMKRFISKVQSIDRGEKQDAAAANSKPINIFISYCWHSRKEAVHEMARFLMQQSDFKVWIDMDNMSGYTYDSMAKGIDGADVVIVFFSSDYADSPNCRREIEYAANKNKEILPIRVEAGYRPDGWLLFIFKSQLRFDFCENDNFYDAAAKICEYVRTNLGTSGNRPTGRKAEVKSTVNFKCVGAPFFSKSKYFNRPDDEDRILAQMKNIAENPDDGCLVVSGDGGVGKTTLMARLLVDEKNHPFFVRECNFHRAIWINCFDWRDVFDEKAFVDKIVGLAKELEDSERSANFSSLQAIAAHFKKKNLRVAFVLDDMFNYRLIQSFMDKLTEPPICFVVTRDAQTIIETNFGMVQKVERVEELSDDGIKEMLKTTFKLNKFLSDDQLYKLATLCCGLPLIASLIAARISNCEDRQEAKGEFKVLTSPQYRISDLKTQNRSFKTVSNLFTFSLDQMDSSLRSLYYAFLLFNPAEPISIFDLGILWGFDLDEGSRCGLRGVCRAFEKRSLVRRVKKQLFDKEGDGDKEADCCDDDDMLDDSSEDRFLLHQMLYEAALEKAKKEYRLKGDDDECLGQIRVKLISGDMGSADCNGSDGDDPGLSVLLGAIKFHRRVLIERIINKLSADSLSEFCTKRSKQTNGMPFLQYLYHFEWQKKKKPLPAELTMLGFQNIMNFNACYRIIKRIFLKLLEAGGRDLLWKVISERQTGKRCSLFTDILDDAKNQNQALDRIPLLAKINQWFRRYSEMKWEEKLFDSDKSHVLVQKAYLGDLNSISEIDLSPLADNVLEEAIQTAARQGHLQVVEFLVQRFPAGVKSRDEEQRIPLMLAAKNGHLDVVSYLYEKCPETIKWQDVNKRSAILWCAKNGFLECVKFLFEKDPETAKLIDQEGTTPLMGAAGDGYTDVVEFLVKACPDLIKMRGTGGVKGTAFVFAAANGQTETLGYLFEKYPREEHVMALTMAAAVGQLESVKYIAERDPEVPKINDSNIRISALMLAASGGHLNVVEYLYGKSDVTVKIMNESINALMIAATSGHLDIVQFLHLKDPELVKCQSSDGESAITIAAKMGHREVVQYLQDNS